MNPGFIIAISALTAIFFGALIILIAIIRKKLCKPFDMLTEYYHPDNALDHNLVENMELPSDNASGVELEEVPTSDTNELYFEDETWRESIIDLLPHCLEILETAYLLTDNVVKLTSLESKEIQLPETLSGLVPLAKKIGLRVDEVVRSMYPPLDPRLLEARCSALALSVNHLLLLAKSILGVTCPLDWVDQTMADVEGHLQVLREASVAFEKNSSAPRCSRVGLEATHEATEEKTTDLLPQSSLVTSSSV